MGEHDKQQNGGERLPFEALLADLSAQFINLPADQVDALITHTLRRVCECLGLDLAMLWQWEVARPGVFALTHYYRRLDGPPIARQIQAADSFPWALREVQASRSLVISSVEHVPAGAERDGATFRCFGVKNVVLIPLCAGGAGAFGAVSFHDMVTPRTWSDTLLERLGLVAQILANALLRGQAAQALRDNEARLSMAADSSGMGLWGLDLTSRVFWVTPKIREFFGLAPDEPVHWQRWLETIHPEDLELVERKLQAVVRTGKEERVEYRVIQPDGGVRWLVSRGRLQPGALAQSQRVMGVTLDITERKLEELAQRESAARLAAAMDVAALGAYELRGDGSNTFFDDRLRAMLGLPDGPASEARKFWIEHVHPDDRDRILELSRKVFEGTVSSVSAEYVYVHPQHGAMWLRQVSRVFERDAQGGKLHILGVIQDVTEQKRAENALRESEAHLRQALQEVQTLRDRLQNENVYLREQVLNEAGHGTIIGDSAPILKVLAQARRVAATDSAVLITGETGTGKELLAQAIHDLSVRKHKLMVKVNCAALPAPLIESELFGREKGAYTGAMTQQVGRFEIAHGSTIFLDEIGDLPLDLQVKLLRILQDGLYERLGSNRTLKADVRVIAATNRDLAAMIKAGKFREDLFHRLNVFPIEVPPLRMRVDDIPLLTWKMIQEFNVKMGRSIDNIPKASMAALKRYIWPGNVRELRNVIERAMIVSDGRSLRVELPEAGRSAEASSATLKDVERQHILAVLEQTHWRIRGPKGAAEILGLLPTTLHSRMKKLGLVRPVR